MGFVLASPLPLGRSGASGPQGDASALASLAQATTPLSGGGGGGGGGYRPLHPGHWARRLGAWATRPGQPGGVSRVLAPMAFAAPSGGRYGATCAGGVCGGGAGELGGDPLGPTGALADNPAALGNTLDPDAVPGDGGGAGGGASDGAANGEANGEGTGDGSGGADNGPTGGGSNGSGGFPQTMPTGGGGGGNGPFPIIINPVGVVPEPATWAMMVMGFGAVAYGLRRRMRRASLG